MKKSGFSPRGKWLAAILVLGVWPLAPAFAAVTAPVTSAPITLAWDSANDPSVRGYIVYYGQTNQPATNSVNAGTNLFVTLFGLLADTGYWFYAVSYNAAGNESVPSNQLWLTAPVCSPVWIVRLATGDFRLALRAAPGSVCQVEYADTPGSRIWQILGLATADANGDVAVIDAGIPQRWSRFYRAARLANPPPFTRLQLAKQTDGSLRLNLNGSPGTTWGLQCAAPPGNPLWTTFATVTANATGDAVLTNPPPSTGAWQFYRAQLQ